MLDPLNEDASLGVPAMIKVEDFLATAVALIAGAWERVRCRPGLSGASAEPDITGALWAELWNEKEHWTKIGRCRATDPPYIDDEVAQRRHPTVSRPQGWVDIRFVYS